MDSALLFLSIHAAHAHWFILVGLLLAGCNLPVSIDLLVIAAALLSVHYVPENTVLLYIVLLAGCSLSAWVAYVLGRFLGPKLTRLPVFRSILSEKKIASMKTFYKRHGVLTFFIGRFVPFGVRNCLFMTSGLSRFPFLRFAILDFCACFVWVTSFFLIVRQLGENFSVIWPIVKATNVFIFAAFIVALISLICYKRTKKPSEKNSL